VGQEWMMPVVTFTGCGQCSEFVGWVTGSCIWPVQTTATTQDKQGELIPGKNTLIHSLSMFVGIIQYL